MIGLLALLAVAQTDFGIRVPPEERPRAERAERDAPVKDEAIAPEPRPLAPGGQAPPPVILVDCRVDAIVRGDLLACAGGGRVNLAGIAVTDAESAMLYLGESVLGQTLRCMPTGGGDRRLRAMGAYCRGPDGDVSCSLVRRGVARALTARARCGR